MSGRRICAQLSQSTVPDGICLDVTNGIWVASPTTRECLRVEEGGRVTHRIAFEDGAFACMLGGADRHTLFILTASSSDPDVCRRNRDGRIQTVTAPYAGAGLP